MDFSSDTSAPAHPAILEALARANSGMAPSYGADEWTARAKAALRDVFETDLEVYFVASGTAANSLALSVICPSYGSILCHEEAHIERDERGAPEFYTGGGKLHLLPGAHAKIDAGTLERVLSRRDPDFVHETPAMALSVTNLTECGTAYSADEVSHLAGMAHAAGLRVHMDGARFANALISQNVSAADLTWKAGIDIMSLGATKNGALGCEAIILFGDQMAAFQELQIRAKRAGHMPAKMRYLSAQMCAYLENDLWLTLAGHANASARRLASVLSAAGLNDIVHSVDGNEVFVNMSDDQFSALQDEGLKAYRWIDGSVRLVCSWTTSEASISRLENCLPIAIRGE